VLHKTQCQHALLSRTYLLWTRHCAAYNRIIRQSGALINSALFRCQVMCLILFANRPNEKYRLVIAANRDEFYARDANRAAFWSDNPQILAGRDLTAGGTWLGVNRNGRFAAVTNFRETPPEPLPPKSRGELTTNFLNNTQSARDYVNDLKASKDLYKGFNLIVDDGSECVYYSNRAHAQILESGFYGLSNQLLDCDWPKVVSGREELAKLVRANNVEHDALLGLLLDEGNGDAFSNSFIKTAEYGTCASTILTISTTGELQFIETGFTTAGKKESEKSYNFVVGEA